MYSRGTILSRREPFPEGDAREPYNRVEVLGTSPIAHMGGAQTWSGVSAQGVIVQPAAPAFGGTIDRPLGELQADYAIESEPEPIKITPSIRVINAHTREAGPSPEEQFAEAAAAAAPKTRKRA